MSDQRSGEPIADRPDDEGTAPEPPVRERRPALERIGLAAVAVVMAVLFAAVAVAAFIGHEYFLAAMGLIGCMMTLAVGGATLLRG
jgi:hypothetical protein